METIWKDGGFTYDSALLSAMFESPEEEGDIWFGGMGIALAIVPPRSFVVDIFLLYIGAMHVSEAPRASLNVRVTTCLRAMEEVIAGNND